MIRSDGVSRTYGSLFRQQLARADDVDGWARAAADLVWWEYRPDQVVWQVQGQDEDLFGAQAKIAGNSNGSNVPSYPVPAALRSLARHALLHSDPERFALLYRLAWRLRDEPELLRIASDPDVARAQDMARAVRRDMHKMTAFVRFRALTGPDGAEVFVAWFEPDHHIVSETAPFFVRRFASMRWSILTPQASAHWTGEALSIGPGGSRADRPGEDALEEMGRTYFASIFNPARLKVNAMTSEMPKKYWKNLPEASLIEPMIRDARERTRAMIEAPPAVGGRTTAPAARPDGAPAEALSVAADDLPQTMAALATAIRACTRCDIYKDATQVVPGEGPVDARIMFVGEQPGDQEDLVGKPFVGPAGQLFDKAIERVGISRSDAFVTNAVKHFKFEPRGKRRIHKRADAGEIKICSWWLENERRLLKPKLIVALGATAMRAVANEKNSVTSMRGAVRTLADGTAWLATVHPSFLLRLTEPEDKRREWYAFLADLTTARDYLACDAA